MVEAAPLKLCPEFAPADDGKQYIKVDYEQVR